MGNTVTSIAGIALGFVLSLMIYSYLLGDNPLYRLAIHLLVGLGMGFATVVVTHSVVIPQLARPVMQLLAGQNAGSDQVAQLLVLLLAALLLLKLSPRTSPLGNVAMAFVMGVGAAVAVGGAVLGTLLPQIGATALPLLPSSAPALVAEAGSALNILAALVVIAGTLTALLYFHFGAVPAGEGRLKRPAWVRAAARVGQGFLMIAFGSLFAGALIASLSLLTERIQFLIWAPGEILRLLAAG